MSAHTLPDFADSTSFLVSRFPTAFPAGPAYGTMDPMTWSAFTALIGHRRHGEKDGPNFVPATFKLEPDGKVRRLCANLVARTAIALDIETNKQTGEVPPPLADVVAGIKRRGWTAALYTSHSHTPGAPRYRVVLPLSAEINPELPAVEVIAKGLGVLRVLDTGKIGAASLFYLPSAKPGHAEHHQAETVTGVPISAAWMQDCAGRLLATRDAEREQQRNEALEAATKRREARQRQGIDLDASIIEGIRERLDLAGELVSHGYQPVGDKRYLYPRSESGIAGVYVLRGRDGIERVFSHHSTDPLSAGNLPSWCRVKAIDVVDVVTILDYGGDQTAALRALAARFDIGERDHDARAEQPRPDKNAPGNPEAQAQKRDRKRPLFRALPPAPDFPIAALGELRLAAKAIQETTQAPIAVCAQSVLAAATLAVQAHHDVDLPGAGRRPLTALFLSVLASGERKSSVDRLAVRAIHKVEAGFREVAQSEASGYADAKEIWEHARTQAKRATKGKQETLAEAFRRIGPAPKVPAHPMLLVADPSPESLVLHLSARPWGGLFTAEGGLFLGGNAMNDETRLRTGALLNTLWDGDAIRRLRITTGASFLPGRRCSAHIMVQPVIASRYLADATLSGIGTLGRTLLVAPQGTAGTRLYREPPASAGLALADYDARLDAMMLKPPRTLGDDPTVLDPMPVPLSPDAREMWIAFHDAVETAQRLEGPFHPIRAFASKMAEHAGRLAAVLTIYSNPNAIDVSAEAMAGGIELAKYYAAEMLRLQGSADVALDLDLAARLAEWWGAQSDAKCHLATIYQSSLNAISDAATARRIVGILEDHGWVDRLPAGTVLDDKPRQEAWERVS